MMIIPILFLLPLLLPLLLLLLPGTIPDVETVILVAGIASP